MRALADVITPFTQSWKLEKGNEYLSLPVLKLGVGVFRGSVPLSCHRPLTQGGSQRARSVWRLGCRVSVSHTGHINQKGAHPPLEGSCHVSSGPTCPNSPPFLTPQPLTAAPALLLDSYLSIFHFQANRRPCKALFSF